MNTIESFDNPYPNRDYCIKHVASEFTSLCPKTGHPDFGTIEFEYIPDKLCVELKSLKLYLQDYRNTGAFYEDLINRILDDMVASFAPKELKITGKFTTRGGMYTTVIVNYPATKATTI